MTTYNTGNPVGSVDPKDLYDNAQNLDNIVNGSELSYEDRLGVPRRSLAGIDAAAEAVLSGLGYAPPVTYAAGISLTLTTQTVEYNGEVYAPKLSALPFTTGGTFDPAKFRVIQGVLAADLAATGGSVLVGYDGGTAQDVLDEAKPMANYAALRAYTGRATGVRVTQYGLAGFFQRDDADATSADNGGTIIVDGAGRRWKRQWAPYVDVMWFGAKGDYSPNTGAGTDDTAAIQAAINFAESRIDSVTHGSYSPANGSGVVFFQQGSYKVTAPLVVSNKISVLGEGQTEYTFGSRLTQTTANTDLFQVSASAGSTSFSVEKMILRSNAGAGTGHLVNMVRSGGGSVNSQRYVDCTFAQPQAMSLCLAGDDIVIKNCLFDVSTESGNGVQLGTATMLASNVRVSGCNFFNLTNSCIKTVNCVGLVVDGNVMSQPNGSTRTKYFLDGQEAFSPVLTQSFTITGNTIRGARTFVGLGAVNSDNITITGNTVVESGIGAGETQHLMQFGGVASGITISGNTLRGSLNSGNFYNDANCVSLDGIIAGNTFINDGGTGDALSCAKMIGRISANQYSGFANKQMGQKFSTTAAPINPGAIAAGSQFGYALAVTGANFGDMVRVGTISNAWVAQSGIEVLAFANNANSVRVEYRNGTAGTITVPAHDIWCEVTR